MAQLTREPEWDVCTPQALLEEALACLRAVETEVGRIMPEQSAQIEKIRAAVQNLVNQEDERKHQAIKNYQQELQKIRDDIAKTNWNNVGSPRKPK